jgi:hypothetical protein
MNFLILVVFHGWLSHFCTVINLLGIVLSAIFDDDLICDNFAKCELINEFLSEQSNLDDSNSTIPEPIDPLYDKLTQLHITETDIEDVLQLLGVIILFSSKKL